MDNRSFTSLCSEFNLKILFQAQSFTDKSNLKIASFTIKSIDLLRIFVIFNPVVLYFAPTWFKYNWISWISWSYTVK